jgi:kynurenine formamidase
MRLRSSALLFSLVAATGLATGALSGCLATKSDPTEPSPVPDLLAALRGREVVDLTHPVDAKVPYWPGQKYFPMETWDLAKFEEVRAFSRAYRIPEHYGTHIDAPNHFLPGQAAVDAIPPATLFGPAVVFDITAKAATDDDAMLTLEDVRAWEAIHGTVPAGAIALLRTGWGARWNDVAAYRNFDNRGRLRFPSFGLEAATLLLEERGCVALGIDALSVDRGIDNEFPVHRMGSARDKWFLENAAALDRLPPTGAVVFALPIPLRGGSGAQARVLAFLP